MNIQRIRHIETKYLNAVAAVLFVGILGTGVYGFIELGSTPERQNNLIASNTLSPGNKNFGTKQTISQNQALRIARAKNPNADVKKTETTTTETGELVHNIYFSDGTKVAVAAEDGTSSELVPETAPQVSPKPAEQPTDTPPSDPAPTETPVSPQAQNAPVSESQTE